MDLWANASPAYFLALGLVCGMAGFRLGWRAGRPAVLPVVQAALGYAAFWLAWTSRGPVWAAAAVAGWAVGSTLIAVATFMASPGEIDRRVWRAAAYRGDMLEWLRTGVGPESRPVATARSHLREIALYLAAAAISANFLALVLGAVLLGYMNAWVAALLRGATRTGKVVALCWPVWSLARVAGYIALGSAAAAPLLTALGRPAPTGSTIPLIAAGGSAVLADLVLKLTLSPAYRRGLAGAVDLEAVSRLGIAGGEVELHLDDDAP